MPIISDSYLVVGNVNRSSVSLETSVEKCKQLLASAWKSVHVTGTMIKANTDVANGRCPRSISFYWTIQERTKCATLEIAHRKSGKVIFRLEAEKW